MTQTQQFIYMIAVNFINVGLLFLQPFYLLTYRGRRRGAAYLLLTTISLLFFWFIRVELPTGYQSKLIINFSWFFICVLIFFNDRCRRKLIIYAESVLLMIVSELLAEMLLKAMGTTVMYVEEHLYSESAMQGIIFMNIIGYILNFYFVLFWKRLVEHFRMQYMLLYMVVPAYHLLLLILFFERSKVFDAATAAIGLSMMLMGMGIHVMIIYLLQKMEQKVEVEERLSELYRQRQYEQEYYQMNREHLEQMREIRHDFINQIQTAYLLIQNGKGKEHAKELLDQASRELRSTCVIEFCSNPVLNALISIKAKRAQEQGILFTSRCLAGNISGMEEIDLCSLYGNLLDNAIEACIRIPEKDSRRIELKSVEKGGYYIVSTSNTYYQDKKTGFFKTSKTDRVNHGYGLKLIERICRKYGGELRTEVTEQEVHIMAYLASECVGDNTK